ncbi:hypothetical protein LJR034_001783 [Caballeronia sp. LjRoot34]
MPDIARVVRIAEALQTRFQPRLFGAQRVQIEARGSLSAAATASRNAGAVIRVGIGSAVERTDRRQRAIPVRPN